jgi:hypothetical protein
MTTPIHLGGMTTDPELKALTARFGTPAEGTTLLHADIEAAIGVTRAEQPHRYRTVVDRWIRQLLRVSNIHLAAQRNLGYRVLSPEERVERNIQDSAGGLRALRRATERLQSIPRERLGDGARHRADAAQSLYAKLYTTYTQEKPRIPPPGYQREPLHGQPVKASP